MSCPLCQPEAENILWQDEHCRIIRVNDADYAGYCRVIWHQHVAEMTDLSASDQRILMQRVFAVESTLRTCFAPTKINVASLGNMVPHLHWHLIARFSDDAHFPDPVWAARRRDPAPQPEVDDETLRRTLAGCISRMDD